MNYKYIDKNGKEIEINSLGLFVDLITAGEVKSETLLYNNKSSTWKKASEFEDYRTILADIAQSKKQIDPIGLPTGKINNLVIKQAKVKIGGWLYLVGIGQVLSPIFNLINLKKLADAASTANWKEISSRDASVVISITYEVIAQSFMAIFSLWLLILFLSHAKNFPKMFISYLIIVFVIDLIGIAIVAASPMVTQPQLLGQAIGGAISVLILGLIWIPYFMKSKRVKKTFVR